ncbi:NUDIX hydrolase [Actinophytocola sp.]|uniref:NUDIX hydrolase n=1 Tax=Actinophytocola sp. TaxID=1872138 RepID=UPI003D6B4EF1
MRWIVHGERRVYASSYMDLYLSDVEVPGGERYEHHLVRLPRSVGTLVLDASRVLMVWRHRFTTQTWNWELPGGWVDPGESPERAAARETEEETGWRPGELAELAYIQPCAGITDAEQFLYLATHAHYAGPPRHAFESERVAWIPLADVPAMIARHEIVGGVTLVGLWQVLSGQSDAPAPRTAA